MLIRHAAGPARPTPRPPCSPQATGHLASDISPSDVCKTLMRKQMNGFNSTLSMVFLSIMGPSRKGGTGLMLTGRQRNSWQEQDVQACLQRALARLGLALNLCSAWLRLLQRCSHCSWLSVSVGAVRIAAVSAVVQQFPCALFCWQPSRFGLSCSASRLAVLMFAQLPSCCCTANFHAVIQRKLQQHL